MTQTTPHYVLGFAFDPYKEKVLLIRKMKPTWQAGRLNGVGGHIEDFDEFAVNAMQREFKEETDIDTSVSQWIRFGVHEAAPGGVFTYRMHMFSTVLTEEQCNQTKQTTEEEPRWFFVSNVGDLADDLGMDRAVPGVPAYIMTALNNMGRPFFTTTLES